jgi:hypothetical protein
MIKYIVFLFLSGVPLSILAQKGNVKLSRDSVTYYQKELAAMRKASYDSLTNSDKYKTVYNRLYPDGVAKKQQFGAEINLGMGFQTNNLNGLNTRFRTLNINKQQTTAFSYGASLAFRFKQLLIGGSAYGISADDLSGTSIQAFLSTNILQIKKFIISPQIGFGSQSYEITMRTASPATDFDSYFTSGGNKVNISHRTPILDYSLALKFVDTKSRANRPVIRIGYAQGLKEKAWKVEKGNSANAPIDRVSSFYAQLLFGIGN